MPRKKRRTPSEKKALSLKKDRRNNYGESTTAARRMIPLRKALANRAVRHAANQALETGGQDASDAVERAHSLKKWKKSPDAPLGEQVEKKSRRRQASVNSKVRRKAIRQQAETNGLPDPLTRFPTSE
ncbi:MAG: hypothetical protein OER56_01170 [Hyphomicrobiales bacterium]|nr:hypothetical protein [Hyphomicrobiales bacterium]